VRFYLACVVFIAAAVLVVAAWFVPEPLQAQQAVNLPSTQFAIEPSAHGFAAPPGFANATPARNQAHPNAQPVGEAICTACHSRETQNFAHTVHALGMQVALAANPKTATCEACHGPGSLHAANPAQTGNIIAFTHNGGTPIANQTESCLSCHSGGARDVWLGSVHQRNQLSCSDCHNPMAKFSAEGLTAKVSVSQTCSTCHNDIRQQFNRRSHMPLPEGQMTCVDCHNPHGTFNRVLLKTDTVNETCYQCHAEKRGPFLFEHAPVRDTCLNCHTPHGANQHALLVAPIPMLCQQCHSHTNHPNDLITPNGLMSGNMPDARISGRGCLNCHAQIHGSNNPTGPRFHM